MGKKDKKKRGRKRGRSEDARRAVPPIDSGGGGRRRAAAAARGGAGGDNPLLSAQSAFLSSLPPHARSSFFSDGVAPEERAEVWGRQADIGEDLVNRFAWATPDGRAMRILRHFAPIVEVGCGANAYWARMMRGGGIDVVAYDADAEGGGRISWCDGRSGGRLKKKTKKRDSDSAPAVNDELAVSRGGPEILSQEPIKSSGRALFLCYPDEDDAQPSAESRDSVGEASDASPPLSMGYRCLEHFRGDTIIHVGELFSDTASLAQAPWGRSSSPEFQQRLAAEFHCILRAELPNWLHVRDTISVWRRSQTCTMVFAADSDEEEDEEAEYRHIPEEERLPSDIAAPCIAHLLK